MTSVARRDVAILNKPLAVDADQLIDAAAGCGYAYRRGGAIFIGGSNVGAVTALSAGDVVGVAIDINNGDVWFSRNGTWTQGDPATGDSPEGSGLSAGTYYPGATSEAGAAMKVTLRTLNADFTGTKPAGFQSWASA